MDLGSNKLTSKTFNKTLEDDTQFQQGTVPESDLIL